MSATNGTALAVTQPRELSADQVDLIKRTIAKGATNDELQLFLHVANRTGLDPFARQIYAIKRWDANAQREVMAVQTGIDGYRLVAERTGRYSPGREPSFKEDAEGLISATAYVKKLTADGTWHEVAATAHWSEYVATKKDGSPTRMWAEKPHVMLAKCAEALALRRAFPMELSGVYTAEEMDQAGPEYTPPAKAAPTPAPAPVEPPHDPVTGEVAKPADLITPSQMKALQTAMKEAGLKSRPACHDFIAAIIKRDIASSKDLTKSEASDCIEAAAKAAVIPAREPDADDEGGAS